MDFLDLAKKRYSVRSYKKTPVEEEKVACILEAARVAPSAANLQPTRLVVIDNAEGMEKLSRAANVYSAPLAIIVCADHAKAWKRPADGKSTVDIDASIATDHMMMEATSLGLGSVWICWFDPEVVAHECLPSATVTSPQNLPTDTRPREYLLESFWHAIRRFLGIE